MKTSRRHQVKKSITHQELEDVQEKSLERSKSEDGQGLQETTEQEEI